METLRSDLIEHLFLYLLHDCSRVDAGLARCVPMPVDSVPIGANPVLMNGADGCSQIGIGLANWQKIGRWFKVCRCLGGLVLDCQWMDGLVED